MDYMRQKTLNKIEKLATEIISTVKNPNELVTKLNKIASKTYTSDEAVYDWLVGSLVMIINERINELKVDNRELKRQVDELCIAKNELELEKIRKQN